MSKKKDNAGGKGDHVVTRNRRASHDYILEDRYEAGLVLYGPEIKSIRNHQINLSDGFVAEREGELWLMGVHISPYKQASRFDSLDPVRPRKLLLHRKEIARIISRLRERGYTAVPTMIYLKKGLAKVEIAMAKGKKTYDKRQAIAQRESDREIRRVLKERY